MENEVKEPAPKYNYVSAEQYLITERASGAWRFDDITDPSASFHIQTIGLTISFDDHYRNTGL